MLAIRGFGGGTTCMPAGILKRIATTKNRLVMASGRYDIQRLLFDLRYVPVQPGGINMTILARGRPREKDRGNCRYGKSHFPITSRMTRRKFPPMIFLMSASL